MPVSVKTELETALEPKRQVVVIENNAESPWLEHARQRGVAVVIGDATRADKLRGARAEHASEVFIVTGDDGVNLEVAAELGTLLKRPAKGERTTTSAKPSGDEAGFVAELRECYVGLHQMHERNQQIAPALAHVYQHLTGMFGDT